MPTGERSAQESKASPSFPARAYIQLFEEGHLPPDYQLVADECKARGIPVITKTTDDIMDNPLPLTKHDLVVGNFDWTNLTVRQLGLTMPTPPDYPSCLQHLLERKIWTSTLGEVQTLLRQPESKDLQVFIKPAAHAKAFAAIIEPKDQMLDSLVSGIPGVMRGLPADLPVFCAEIVNMVSEYRAYCVDGKLRKLCQYRGPKRGEEGAVTLDMNRVQEAISLLFDSEEGKDLTGCGIDFAVLDKGNGRYITCLVEVNDGFSLGRYQGLSGKDYTDLLIARWRTLVKDL